MFDRIVIGWDGTSASDAALGWARREYGEVPTVLVRVAARLEHGDVATERSELIDLRERLLDQGPDADIGVRAQEGVPADVLGEYLDPGTLIVIGAARRRHHARWGVGPRLAGRRGGGAVAVIPQAQPLRAATVATTVLAAYDGSQSSMAAAEMAADEARRRALTLEIVHVWEDFRGWSPGIADYLADVGEYEQVHRQMLDEAVERVRLRYEHLRGRLEYGDPAGVLSRIGRDAALVVVAPHGAGSVARFLLGSVTHELLLDPPAPLVVVTLAPQS